MATNNYQRIADLSVAVGLSPTAGSPTYAIIQAEGAPIRWRDDGVDPTPTSGMRIEVGQELMYDAYMSRIKLIQESPGAAANITYYGGQ